MTVQKRKDGSYYISDIVKGYLVWEVYYYCTKREAVRYFKQKVKVKQVMHLEFYKPINEVTHE